MGYYIQTPNNQNKAEQLVRLHNAQRILGQPETFDPPKDKVLICVVQNGPFDAAGICFDSREFDEFTRSSDDRPKTWLLMNKEQVLYLNPNVKKLLEE